MTAAVATRHSLKTRITLGVLAVFVLSIWFLMIYIKEIQREDIQQLLSEQQFSTAAILAKEINRGLADRVAALERIAGHLPPRLLANAAALQTDLEDRPHLTTLFNGGVVAYRRDGTAVAELPREAGRVGLNYMDIDTVATALKQGKSNIGRPVLGKKLNAPVFGITVPIRDASGEVIGAIAGVVNLGLPNFIDQIIDNRYGKTGGYLVVDRQARVIITATDKRRVMEPAPPKGVSPVIDRFIEGHEGTAIWVNPRGDEVMQSVKGIPQADWYLAVALPTAEAFAPLDDLQRHMLLATLLLTLIAGAATWWMLRRQFEPIQAAVAALAAQTESSLPPQALPVSGQDEIGALVVGFNDLLERVQEREQALRESQARYERVVAGTNDGIWDWTPATGEDYLSPRWKQLLGFEDHELPNVAASFFDRIHPGDQAAAAEAVRAHLEERKPYAIELRMRCKDGQYRWFSVRGQATWDEQGKPLHMAGSIADITERKRAETEIMRLNADLEARVRARTADLEHANRMLSQAKAEAEAANVAKSTFLANMSHEIRTPMNAILGMTNILLRGEITPEQARRLATIDGSAQHLLGVINSILDISKIEAGKFLLDEAPVRIGSLVANVRSIVAERATAKGIALVLDTPALPEGLRGDPTRLQQAMLNYVTNAIKFTDKGTVTLRTSLLAETDDSATLRFEVQDTGIGIAAEALPRLFSAFEQVDNSMTRQYGGTGLGLAITRRLAQLMGGDAGVESTLGVGSTFWFEVRLKKGAVRSAPEEDSAGDAETLIRQGYRGARVLVVDDEPINREVAQMQLEAAGLVVDMAVDGGEAVAMAQGMPYAAIFMDMQMPRINGLDATRRIRELPGYRAVPIIAMTANAFAEDRVRCLEAGMDDFLIKPFEAQQLFSILLDSLSRHTA